MEKISPYIKYAFTSLSRKNKFKIVTVGSIKAKIFDEGDIWSEMIRVHKKLQRLGK